MADPSKTESATPKKRREARAEGKVARSQELASSVNLMVGVAMIFLTGAFASHTLKTYTVKVFAQMSTLPGDLQEMMPFLMQAGIASLTLMAPILAALLVAGLLINYGQVGFQFSGDALIPKADRLNPLNGFKRIFSAKGWVELLKAAVKIALSGAIAWSVFSRRLPELILTTQAPLIAGLNRSGDMLWEMAWKVGLFFLVLGAADYAWQKYEFEKNLKMTKQEIRDEYRQTEGDPMVKSKRRSKHRRLVISRMAAEVARADVVTVNPTHYAVAMRYDAPRMRAPKVVAKGQDYWAKRIVAVARLHRIPVIQNKAVTRALYKQVEIGQEIPPALYRAVAEILAALYRLRARRRA
ncbi:MAG: flagellar biosynthesis protein FlhB [Candidatus Firestonebacteria bacterium]|nr:flagellar biosynthesis protein FlhB [Candidatus Firestonebacteria bacterium]